MFVLGMYKKIFLVVASLFLVVGVVRARASQPFYSPTFFASCTTCPVGSLVNVTGLGANPNHIYSLRIVSDTNLDDSCCSQTPTVDGKLDWPLALSQANYTVQVFEHTSKNKTNVVGTVSFTVE